MTEPWSELPCFDSRGADLLRRRIGHDPTMSWKRPPARFIATFFVTGALGVVMGALIWGEDARGAATILAASIATPIVAIVLAGRQQAQRVSCRDDGRTTA
jgi:hypothetical protein